MVASLAIAAQIPIGTTCANNEGKVRSRNRQHLSNEQLTLSVGQRRDLADSTLRLYVAKSSGRIFSNQNSHCLEIHFCIFCFLVFVLKQLQYRLP